MSKFKIGEVTVIVSAKGRPEFVGRECTVIGYVFEDDADYRIEIPGETPRKGGFGFICPSHCLRKKNPPQELSTWEKVQEIPGLGGWNPTKQEERV